MSQPYPALRTTTLLAMLLISACGTAAEPKDHADSPSADAATADAAMAIRVDGKRFVDADGQTVQPRGVNFSSFEFVSIQGWGEGDPTGGQGGQPNGPDWSAITAWKANIVRIPLNEASWLGHRCTDSAGASHDPDPAGNYRQAVQTQVEQAIAAGLYVIIDLHWSAPGNTCPMLQMQMANADNSPAFWTSVADTFKDQPAVMFELFNEPFMNFGFSGDDWSMMMHGTGGRFSSYPATSRDGQWKEIKTEWQVASYQDLIDAVRATGATNVVLIAGMQYAQDMSGWLKHRPDDPIEQMAAVWHPYPTFGASWGSAKHAQPNFAPEVFTDILQIQEAGFPVIATETGDRNTEGTRGAPLITTVTRWADQHGIGVLGWGWNVWEEPDHVLIRDVDGTPTDGYGEVFREWLLSH